MVHETEDPTGSLFIDRLIKNAKEMRANEDMFRLLIEHSHDIIYSITSDGMFTYVSPVWTQLLGHPVSEVLGKSFLNFVHPDDVPACLVWLQKIIESGQRQEGIEYRVKHLNGEWVMHTSSAVPFIDDTNTVAGYYGIASDITVRKRVLEEKTAVEQLRQLAKYTEKAREDERISISRDLHDDLGQALTAIKIHLGLIKQKVPDEEAVLKINKVTDMVGEAIKAVKRITTGLRPEILDELGLEAAIIWYAKEFEKRNNVEIVLGIITGITIPVENSLSIFRIIQESLTNISRHAGATKVYISLSKTSESVILRISDNGIGITETQKESKNSFGIMSMRERAASLGGSFDIYGEEGYGTVLKIIIPLNQ